MVKLTRIYTRGGDKGQTSLGSGKRVPKHDPRVDAYGQVDEANAAIGLANEGTDQVLPLSLFSVREVKRACQSKGWEFAGLARPAYPGTRRMAGGDEHG